MLSRRKFIKLCMSSALTLSLTSALTPILRQAYAETRIEKPPVIWLELGSCTGNTISLDNAVNPSLHQFLTETIDLRYHWTFNAAQGTRPSLRCWRQLPKMRGSFGWSSRARL